MNQASRITRRDPARFAGIVADSGMSLHRLVSLTSLADWAPSPAPLAHSVKLTSSFSERSGWRS
jgi:hypothetical protein